MKRFISTFLILLVLGTTLVPLNVGDGFLIANAQEDSPPNTQISAREGGTTLSSGNSDEDRNVPSCFSIVNFSFSACVAGIMEVFLSIAGLALGGAGFLLNGALYHTVVQMGGYISGDGTGESIQVAWTVLRDIANVAFIFVLVFIGFATILQISGYGFRELLVKLVIAALLVNFSFFITGFIIDASNILTIGIYQELSGAGGGGVVCTTLSSAGTDDTACIQQGISNLFMEELNLETLYDLSVDGGLGEIVVDHINIIFVGALGSIFLLITAFVFFAAAILLITRFVVLIFLLILSPLMFAAMVLPQTAGHAKKWWRMLFSQSFFAPAYLLLTFLSLSIMQSVGDQLGAQDDNFAAAIVGEASEAGVFINFAIVTGFMIASLVIAKNMGAYGAQGIIKFGHGIRRGAQGFAGRNTLGRFGYKVANSELMRKFEAATPAVGGAVRRTVSSGSSQLKFGSKRSYEDALKQKTKQYEETVKHAGQTKYGEETEASKARAAQARKNIGNFFRGDVEAGRKIRADATKEQKKKEKQERNRTNKETDIERKLEEIEALRDDMQRTREAAEQSRKAAENANNTDIERLMHSQNAQSNTQRADNLSSQITNLESQIENLRRSVEEADERSELASQIEKTNKKVDDSSSKDSEGESGKEESK